VRFGALAAAGAILLAGLTAVRSGADRDRSGVEMVTRLAEADFKTGLVQIASGQQAALNSMWIIENYPEQFEYNTLSTLVYIAVNPIPRVLWEGKPIALGRLAVFQARADRQRLSNYTIGPGIIGHIVSDNPWLAMVPYALGLGLFLRLLDELVRNRPHNIFVVLPIGVAIGQFIGLSRGDSGLFFFYASVTMIAAWISMWVVVRVLQAFGWTIEMEDEHAGDWPAGEPPEYGDEGPAGQSESAG
jgi:hypothetical protein